ncbi:MAG: hypothetical protein KDB53_01270, partial [Planctomycetes bacterium]|nr:hypothetical protein [Planctomycetota bacterium]
EAGWLALSLGDLPRAQAIFDGLRILSPEDPLSSMGQAEIALALGDAATAKSAARAVQRAENADLQTRCLGIVLEARAELCGHAFARAKTQLEEAIRLDAQGAAGRSARVLLDELNLAETQTQTSSKAERSTG